MHNKLSRSTHPLSVPPLPAHPCKLTHLNLWWWPVLKVWCLTQVFPLWKLPSGYINLLEECPLPHFCKSFLSILSVPLGEETVGTAGPVLTGSLQTGNVDLTRLYVWILRISHTNIPQYFKTNESDRQRLQCLRGHAHTHTRTHTHTAAAAAGSVVSQFIPGHVPAGFFPLTTVLCFAESVTKALKLDFALWWLFETKMYSGYFIF